MCISDAESYATAASTTGRVSHSEQVSAEMPDEDKPLESGQQQTGLMFLAEDQSGMLDMLQYLQNVNYFTEIRGIIQNA